MALKGLDFELRPKRGERESFLALGFEKRRKGGEYSENEAVEREESKSLASLVGSIPQDDELAGLSRVELSDLLSEIREAAKGGKSEGGERGVQADE